MAPISKESLFARIDSFSAYERGWYRGEGEVIEARFIERVKAFLTLLLASLEKLPEFEVPSSFPMISGGIQVEWHAGYWAVDLSFEPDGKIRLGAYHSNSHQDDEKEVQGIILENVSVIVRWLRSYW